MIALLLSSDKRILVAVEINIFVIISCQLAFVLRAEIKQGKSMAEQSPPEFDLNVPMDQYLAFVTIKRR